MMMNQRNPSFSSPPTPPWVPMLPPLQPPSSAFWETSNVISHLQELRHTLDLAKAMQKELEMLTIMKNGKESIEGVERLSNDDDGVSLQEFSKCLEDNRINLTSQESVSVEIANALMLKLRAQLEPFRIVTDESSPWEEKSAAVRLANKTHKYKRNKLWRKRKRKQVVEMRAREHEQFEQADREADEWRAREIAKDIAKGKVEKMKKIAKLKAKEEKKRFESELELVLIVEKLQELRSIRIQKLKKQGHFMPDEDDKFLERVRAAVEEEEQQTLAAADTDAAKEAIATAEESRKTIQNQQPEFEDQSSNIGGKKESQDQIARDKIKEDPRSVANEESGKQGSDEPGSSRTYDSIASLPVEFYHYYHGSSTDIGTLIEVRRTWDAYIRPGGSRIPGHWIQPPSPADEIWASYLAMPK